MLFHLKNKSRYSVGNLYIYSESFEGPNFYIMPAILYSHLHLGLPSGPLCSDLQTSMPYITTNWCRKQTQLHNISFLCITKRCHIIIPSLWSSCYRKLTTFMSWNLGASIFWNPHGLSRPVLGFLFAIWTVLQLVHIQSMACQWYWPENLGWIFELWWLIDCDWVWDLTVPMHLGFKWWALCAPYQFMGSLLLY